MYSVGSERFRGGLPYHMDFASLFLGCTKSAINPCIFTHFSNENYRGSTTAFQCDLETLKKLSREWPRLWQSLTINALRAYVYIYIWQLSSFRAPTLWFIDPTVATCNTLFWVYANFFHEKMDKTRKYSKSAIFVWYENGHRRLLGAQSINTERTSLRKRGRQRQRREARKTLVSNPHTFVKIFLSLIALFESIFAWNPSAFGIFSWTKRLILDLWKTTSKRSSWSLMWEHVRFLPFVISVSIVLPTLPSSAVCLRSTSLWPWLYLVD